MSRDRLTLRVSVVKKGVVDPFGAPLAPTMLNQSPYEIEDDYRFPFCFVGKSVCILSMLVNIGCISIDCYIARCYLLLLRSMMIDTRQMLSKFARSIARVDAARHYTRFHHFYTHHKTFYYISVAFNT
jgi:hypothetical protein